MNSKLSFHSARKIIFGELLPYCDKKGIDPSSIDSDHDLLRSGLIDSLDFLELIEAIEENNGLTFDFSKVEVPDISRLECLINELVRQNHETS